ncbi:hypothetical protein SAMN05428997_15311 [Bosea sp. CRIB-10]|uniref:Acb2/Tad1 domain-containing protein n=1 Tax=Bosea sp. CRIB-10 TaxID=378404 RepID=UPI0008F4390B|nr:hypothetical protein [Bosea sp. CRIB-10]SFD76387.1 hypothetical protein SAMN05428997_15311 [Bosea sp. CRIB-10]
MTTTVIVKANHGWPVTVMQVDPASCRTIGEPVTVEPSTERTFYVHSGADLHVHEVQPATEVAADPVASHRGLPVAGYRPQTEGAVATVNANKRMEELLLRMLDALQGDLTVDQRWLAIGRSQIEQGFMAVNRAVFRPERLKGDIDTLGDASTL